MNGISVVSATLVGYFHVLLSRPRFCGQRIQFPKPKPKQFIESKNTKGVDEKHQETLGPKGKGHYLSAPTPTANKQRHNDTNQLYFYSLCFVLNTFHGFCLPFFLERV